MSAVRWVNSWVSRCLWRVGGCSGRGRSEYRDGCEFIAPVGPSYTGSVSEKVVAGRWCISPWWPVAKQEGWKHGPLSKQSAALPSLASRPAPQDTTASLHHKFHSAAYRQPFVKPPGQAAKASLLPSSAQKHQEAAPPGTPTFQRPETPGGRSSRHSYIPAPRKHQEAAPRSAPTLQRPETPGRYLSKAKRPKSKPEGSAAAVGSSAVAGRWPYCVGFLGSLAPPVSPAAACRRPSMPTKNSFNAACLDLAAAIPRWFSACWRSPRQSWVAPPPPTFQFLFHQEFKPKPPYGLWFV